MHPHDKLFIPGPVEVSEKTWEVFATIDWASQRRFSESLPRDSSQASDVVWHKAAGVSFHFVGVGSDGSIYSERG